MSRPIWEYTEAIQIKAFDKDDNLWRVDILKKHRLEARCFPYKIPPLDFLKGSKPIIKTTEINYEAIYEAARARNGKKK